MKRIVLIVLVMLFSFSFTRKGNSGALPSIHKFKVKAIDGEEFDFKKLKGKKILIINTASLCGYTPQYKQLQEMYDKYKAKNFIIVGFPSNDFGQQEPGSNSEIKEFCKKNYGVTFPMMEKVSVKGDGMCDIYKWLTQKEENGVMNSKVKWNFQKYLIDENGALFDTVSTLQKPDCKKIVSWIEGKK